MYAINRSYIFLLLILLSLMFLLVVCGGGDGGGGSNEPNGSRDIERNAKNIFN